MVVTKLRTFLLTSCALTCPLLALSAHSQEPNRDLAAQEDVVSGPQESVATGHATSREIVVVTAQKRAQDIQSIPSAVSALGTDEILDRGLTSASDLQFIVPNVQIGKMSGTTAVTIRGVGLNQGAPGVAIHVDGFYQPTASMGDLGQLDIQRVEVLRGPQGTLYGRNANGGVINFITTEPTDIYEGHVQVGFAEYNDAKAQAVVNVPFSERIRARALVNWRDRRDGFVENVLPNGQDVDKFANLTGRLRVTADLTDTLTFDLNATTFRETGPSFYYNLNTQPLPGSAIAEFPEVIVPGVAWQTSINDPVDSSRTYTLVGGTFNWDIGDWTLRSATGWQRAVDKYRTDNDTVNVSVYPQTQEDRTKTFTEELNLSGSVGPVDAVFGAFYMDSDDYHVGHFDILDGGGGLPPDSNLHFENFQYDTVSSAIFGDMTWNVSERLRLLAGVRYSEDKITQTQENYITFGPTAPVYTCTLRTNEIESNSTTPRAGIQYDLTPDNNVYFTASKGFKAGGFNERSCEQSFGPEKVTAYEIGSKNVFLQNALTFNTSAFYYEYDDLQLSQVVGLAVSITNAAAAEVKGLELEGTWDFTDNWSLNGNVSLLDAKFISFDNVDSLNPSAGLQSVAGNYLNNAPEVSANLGLAYTTDPSDIGTWTFRADGSYRSKYYFREFNADADSQEAVGLLNLAIIWDSPDDKYRVRLYGTNVTNEDYLVRMAGATALGGRFVTWGPPRQLGAEFMARF